MSFDPSKSRLSRPQQPMPVDVFMRLEAEEVTADYNARPAYQRNDYLAWIARAKRPEIRERRITHMVEELRQGGIYMGMDHPRSRKD